MPIHRQFTASCDVCGTPFTGDGEGYARVVNGVSQYSDELKDALRQNGWSVSNEISCPTCQLHQVRSICAAIIKQVTKTTNTTKEVS